MPVGTVISAIAAAVRVTIWIKENGFKPGIQYHEDYRMFVHEVASFEHSLVMIKGVFDQAYEQRKQEKIINPVEEKIELAHFKQIVGDFEDTLQHCQELVQRRDSFANPGGGLLTRIAWNASAVQDVKELRERLHYHSVRLTFCLEPLKIGLTIALKDAIDRGFARMGASLQKIARALGVSLDEPDDDDIEAGLGLPDIPEYLEACLDRQASSDADLPVDEQVCMSSIMGHLNNSILTRRDMEELPRALHVIKYVSLTKVIWILKQPSTHQYSQQEVDRLLTQPIRRSLQSQALTTSLQFGLEDGRIAPATTPEIKQLKPEAFTLWLFQPGVRPLEPMFAEEFETTLLKVPLVGTSPGELKEMIVIGSKTDRHLVRIVSTSLDRVGRSRNTDRYNLDTRNAVLIPTYAQSGAQLNNVQVRASTADKIDKTYQFHKLKDLLDFQRCMTGYEVRLDQGGIKGVQLKRSGFRTFARSEELLQRNDSGRLQLWDHRSFRIDGSSSDGSEGGSVVTSMSPTSGGLNSTRKRKPSQASSYQSQTNSVAGWTLKHANTTRTEESVTRGGLRASSVAILDVVEPKVVVLLSIMNGRSESSLNTSVVRTLQFLSFSIDEGLEIDTHSCDCRRHPERCRQIVVVGSNLRATLHDFENDLGAWNIATLGSSRRGEQGHFVKTYDNLDRIVIEFGHAGDREVFGQWLNNMRILHITRQSDRERTIRSATQTDIA